MNAEHLRTFVWLRWRLRVNQLKKGGVLNTVVLAIAAAGIVMAAVGMAIGCFLVGLLVLGDAPPVARLFVWDGLVVAYLFCWAIVLLNDLQRSESLSLEKFLHLPVSPTGVFVVNYLSSLVGITTIIFAPAMIALGLGLTFSRGVTAILAVPLVVAFFFAITAVTYQFQGWLATLMTNPRRRRTVIVCVTAGFILVFQLPNLVNLLRPWDGQHDNSSARMADSFARVTNRYKELTEALGAGRITPEENQRLIEQVQREEENRQREEKDRKAEETRRTWEQVEGVARLVNGVLPPGWLPLGAAAAEEGAVVPALLAGLGFVLIGTVSLWRAYRTTVRLYTGQTSSGDRRPPGPIEAAPDPKRVRLVEWVLPGVKESTAAVALAGFRSLTRAPEVKMALLAPLIIVILVGSALVSKASSTQIPEPVRPLIAFGAVVITLLSAVQLAVNQFGYDRSGFRAFVLSPVPRWEILFGKNLAIAPFAYGAGLTITVFVGCLLPMRFDHFLMVLADVVIMCPLLYLPANAMSIFVPIPMAAGSFKPSSVKAIPVLFQMLFIFAIPIILLPLLLPLGIEVALTELEWIPRYVPIALGLTVVLAAAVLWAYRPLLRVQGDWLAAREQRILEVVTSKEE
jgi:hypothetical protein